MTDFTINVYDRELMRKFALLRGCSEASFDRVWADFDTNRRACNRMLVELKLAEISRRPETQAAH